MLTCDHCGGDVPDRDGSDDLYWDGEQYPCSDCGRMNTASADGERAWIQDGSCPGESGCECPLPGTGEPRACGPADAPHAQPCDLCDYPERFCACGRRPGECDGSRKGCSR